METRGRRRFTAEEAVNLLLEDSGDDDFLFESSEDDDLDELFTVEDLQDDAERAYFEEETAANDFDLDEEPSNSSSEVPMLSSDSPLSSKRAKRTERLVTGIDEALDPGNYDDLPVRSSSKTFTASLGPVSKKNTDKIRWTDQPLEARGRQRICDVIKEKPGLLTRESKSVESVRYAFDFFSQKR